MVKLACVPMAASPTRLSEKRILLIVIVFTAKARFKSNLNRRIRKALLIGISYTHSEEYELHSPYRDVKAIRSVLIEKYGFRFSDIIFLSDQNKDVAYKPTRQNMIRELKRFVSPENKNTDYVFVYSGHCIQLEVPRTHEQPDGLAESLVPVDAVTFGGVHVRDMGIFGFDLKRWLVEPLESNSRLVAIIDACSSATVLNLEHHRCNRTGSITAKARQIGRMCISQSFGNTVIPKFCLPKSLSYNKSKAGATVGEVSLDACTGFCSIMKREQSPVVCISACKDSETVFENKEGQSLIQSILNLWADNPNPTYKELAKAARNDSRVMRDDIRKDFRHFLRENRSPSWTGILRNNPLSRWIASHNYVREWHMQISTLSPLDVDKRFSICRSAGQ